jgi:hypothetical protein
MSQAKADLGGFKSELGGAGAAAEKGLGTIRISAGEIAEGVRGFAGLAAGETTRARTSFLRIAISICACKAGGRKAGKRSKFVLPNLRDSTRCAGNGGRRVSQHRNGTPPRNGSNRLKSKTNSR